VAKADDFMLTAEELRLREAKRRRILIVFACILVVGVFALFTARPAMHAIKAFQARRHATRAFEFLEQEKWTDARNEALAAYRLRSNEPQALRAVARYLTRTRQQQALDFWKQLREIARLTREDLLDEATIALVSGETERAAVAVSELLANEKKAAPRDWLIAVQLSLQKGAAPDALRDLEKIFENKAATERELLQAAILELQASNSADAEANRRTQADGWARITKLSTGKSETALDALILLARRALQAPSPGKIPDATPSISSEQVPAVSPAPTIDSESIREQGAQPINIPELIAAIERHPLAKAPHKLVAINLQMHANPAEKEACIARAIADWKDAEAADLAALAAWLNGFGEFQRELDTIPLEKALQSRDLFLQHLDALGALGRWDEIKRVLEAERFPLDAVIQRMYLARCNAQLGQKAAAENNWQRALEAAGGDMQKLLTVASYAEKNGALDIAAAAYDSAASATPRLRGVQQGRLRIAQAARDTKKIQGVLADMLALWPNDTAIRNDEAYIRLLLLPDDPASLDELIAIEKLAESLVQREPASLPHRTLLALSRLKQHRPVAALEAYAKIQATPNALSPSALAVHAAVLSANGQRDDAVKEIQQAPVEKLLPEEQAGTVNLRE
jgi:hypothetical protein